MKKYILLIIAILVGISCFLLLNNKNDDFIPKTNQDDVIQKEEEIVEEEEPSYVDNNPIKLGLYKNYRNGGPRKLITTYEENWTYHKDISSFEVFYTQEEEISNGSQIKVFDEYKNNYENIEDYRIGYIINFKVEEREINKTILSPVDTEEFYDYLEIYLYDDYHRHGEWYSHTTESQMNEETLLTSIKLTAGKDVNEILSDIKVTAFTYIKDDIDDDNNYLGNSSYSIIVKKK